MNTQNKKDDEIPNAQWQTWGLIQAARELPNMPPLIGWCLDRLQAFDISGCYNPQERVKQVTSYVVRCPYTWGRGKTIGEAAKAVLKAGASRTDTAVLTVVLNDTSPWVGGMGGVNANSAAMILDLGPVGTLGAMLKVNKDL